MNDKTHSEPLTDEDRDEAVVAADDTGILSEQREMLEAEIAQQLGADPSGDKRS